jgi:hypothetical protein
MPAARRNGAHRPGFFKETAAVVNVGGPPDLEKINAVMASSLLKNSEKV